MKCNCGETRSEKFYKGNPGKCKNCRLKYQEDYWIKNKAPIIETQRRWRVKNPAQARLKLARIRAKEKGLKFSLTKKDITEMLQKQENRCIYSNIEFNNNSKYDSMSLDRIDSSKGYTKDNIQLTTTLVNKMKNDLSEKEFLKVIEKIYTNLLDNAL